MNTNTMVTPTTIKSQLKTYLGDTLSVVELTEAQFTLAAEMGVAAHPASEASARNMAIGHAMIMLGLVRSKFSPIEAPGGCIVLNGSQLLEMGKYFINNT